MLSKSKGSSKELNDTFKFVRGFLLEGLKEVNPWVNIRIMHTNIGQDIMSGIVVAIVALPLALAFGVGSGLGAAAGIWGAIAGGIIGGIFGGSKVGVSGPTGPKMVQLATIMVGYRLASGEPDFTAAMTMIFLSGVILVILSFLKVSRLIYYTPYSVVAGFMCGIGVIVMLLEFDSFLGLPAAHTIVEAIYDIPKAIMHADPQALLVSVPTLAILFIWPRIIRLAPRLRILPGPLAGLLVGTAIAHFAKLNIQLIGEIPTGLPQIYLPDIGLFRELFIPAFSLAGLAVFDSLLTCVVADHLTGDKHSSDRETFGQGLANMAAALVGGLTTATATMRTATNINAGGKTPLASVVHGLVLLTLILGLGFLAENIPMACLAAILFKVGIDILDYRILPVLHRLPLTDMIVFWVVLIVTVVEDLLIAMGVGMVLAFFRFVQEVSRVYRHQVVFLDHLESDLISEEVKEKIKVLRPQGPLFFGSIEPLEETYKKAHEHDILLVDLKEVTMCDLSGAYALEELIIKARKEGKDVFVFNANKEVENVLRRVKIMDHIGENYFFNIAEDAIIQAQTLELVRLTQLRMVGTAEEVKAGRIDHARLAKAANYAREAIKNVEKRALYERNEDRKGTFVKALEDYLLGPEISDIRLNGYNGQAGVDISCVVKDNYKVARVAVTILCLSGNVVERGEAIKDSTSDIWVYTTQTNSYCEKGIRINIEASDVPQNISIKELSVVFDGLEMDKNDASKKFEAS